MDKIAKIAFNVDGDNITFGVPFSKIDIKNRTVEGFATLDNVDKSDEVVDSDASKQAFESWIGNVREMHAPKAVGKAVQIEARQLEQDGQVFNGIHVKTKISKGAPDTWEKILDGTLAGYSIGGKVLERRPEVVKADDGKFSQKNVMRITKYHLGELSVVDNPMNPLALLGDINKSEGSFQKSVLVKNDSGLAAGDAIIEDKNLFYCDSCDVAKIDDQALTSTECLTCDNMMVKIGEVMEPPSVTKLKKMVDDYHDMKKGTLIDAIPDKVETDDAKLNSLGLPIDNTTVPIETANPTLIQQVNLPEGSPQSTPAGNIKSDDGDALAAQKAEGDSDLDELLKEIGEVLKGRGESTNGAPKKKPKAAGNIGNGKTPMSDQQMKDVMTRKASQQVEFDFIDTMMDLDLFRVTNANATPPKGKPTDSSKYADPANYKYPVDNPARIRAAMVYFNHPGQREAGGYSMTQWASIGKRIASAANSAFGSGHSYSGGKVMGMTKLDGERGDMIFNLQLNDNNGTTNIVTSFKSLFGFLRESTEPPLAKGGETQELDTKELVKIADILATASKEVNEVLKGFGVQELNSEDGSSGSVGGNDPGDAGVGTDDSSPNQTLSVKDTTVATTSALPAGQSNVNPEAIPGANVGAVASADAAHGDSNVLPHAPSLQNADEATDLIKGVITQALEGFSTKVDEKFNVVANRLETIENSGGTKKSGDVNTSDDLQKSDSLWGGVFSAGEISTK